MRGKREGRGILWYRKWSGLLFGLAALVVVLMVLFAGDDVGLSNNGDFNRVINASSLSYGERAPNFTYADTYVIKLDQGSAWANLTSILLGTEGLERYPSIHVGLVRLSVAVNLVVNRVMGWEVSTYHIQALGVMYALLYAAGIGLLCHQLRLRRLWQDVVVKAAALLVLCDVGYVAYFNSFYGEALEHVALVYCAALLVRVLSRPPTLWDGIWCAVAAAVYGWAKFFNIPLACLMVVVMEGIVLLRSRRWRRGVIPGVLALGLLLGVWTAVPGWMDTETNYNAVFYGIIRNVDRETAEGYLRDLGLPEELADYQDTNYYLPGVVSSLEERGLREQAESVGKFDLVKFYLTHPTRLWQQAELTAMHCGMIRPYYLANYGPDHPLMTYTARMSGWSTLRDWMALDTIWGNLAVTAAGLAMGWLLLRRRLGTVWTALALVALAGGLLYSFLLPVMLNGEGDFSKHMFAYAEWIDLLLLACLAGALHRVGSKEPGRLLCPAAGAAALLVLVLFPVAEIASAGLARTAGHSQVEQGAYVTLGTWQGESIAWLVAEEEDGILTLLWADSPITASFDQGGDNDWRTSSARTWLNGEFLGCFTTEERGLLVEQDNRLLLTDRFREEALGGDLDFACSHIAVLADRGYDRAYYTVVQDWITLPDIDLAAELAREGQALRGRELWLETPYCRTENLARYVGGDGHIYFGAAEVSKAVCPVVQVSGEILSGSGSAGDPFVLSSTS